MIDYAFIWINMNLWLWIDEFTLNEFNVCKFISDLFDIFFEFIRIDLNNLWRHGLHALMCAPQNPKQPIANARATWQVPCAMYQGGSREVGGRVIHVRGGSTEVRIEASLPLTPQTAPWTWPSTRLLWTRPPPWTPPLGRVWICVRFTAVQYWLQMRMSTINGSKVLVVYAYEYSKWQ
jgi:hypothetical protein